MSHFSTEGEDNARACLNIIRMERNIRQQVREREKEGKKDGSLLYQTIEHRLSGGWQFWPKHPGAWPWESWSRRRAGGSLWRGAQFLIGISRCVDVCIRSIDNYICTYLFRVAGEEEVMRLKMMYHSLNPIMRLYERLCRRQRIRREIRETREDASSSPLTKAVYNKLIITCSLSLEIHGISWD